MLKPVAMLGLIIPQKPLLVEIQVVVFWFVLVKIV